MTHRRTFPLPSGGRGWEPTGFLGEGDEDDPLLQKLDPNCSSGMLICRTQPRTRTRSISYCVPVFGQQSFRLLAQMHITRMWMSILVIDLQPTAIRSSDYPRGGMIRSINPYSIASPADMK